MHKSHLLKVAAFIVSLAWTHSVFSQISFNASTTSGCKPLVVTFTNYTTAPGAYRYVWNFGDGPFLTDTMPGTVTHTFVVPGNYNVHVDVYNSSNVYLGGANCNNGNIQVNGIDFFVQDSMCLGDQVNLCTNGNVNSPSWNFGDGNTSTQSCISHGYASLGTYTISLTGTGSCGLETVSHKVVVGNNVTPHPNIWATLMNNTACPNQPVGFAIGGSYTSYNWNFGDGQTSTQQSPQHTYTATGTYTFSLTVVNGCGKQGTSTNTVHIVNNIPFPNNIGIGTSMNQSCPNQQVNFNIYNVSNNQFPKYVWDFGDGSPKDSSGSNVNHTFTSLNTYTVTCRIHSFCGNDSVIKKSFLVSNYSPFPNQSWFKLTSNSPVCPGSTVNFNAPCCYNSFQWNFGDGSPVVSGNQNNSSHTYPNTLTTYTASVKITSSCGNDTTIYSTVTISNTAGFPAQNFQLYLQSPSCPNSYSNISAPCGYSSYQYNFGDGSPVVTSTECNSNHLYGSALTTYTVSVKVTNGCGKDTTIYGTIQISNSVGFPNQNWFSLNLQSPICPNSNVNLNAPGGYSTYQWNFGDGSPVVTTTGNNNGNNTNHQYGSTAATYTASVKITNGCGKDTTLYKAITISNSAPWSTQNFQIQAFSSPACPNSNIGFQAPGGYSSYLWNFGDGSPASTSANNNYNHRYGSTLGTYTVSVKITNGCGKDTTLYTTVQISNGIGWPNQNFNLKVQPSPACPNDQVEFNAVNGYVNYSWDFGDGGTTSGQRNDASHSYTAAGTYTASVTITNGCGKDTTIYQAVTISSSGAFSNWLSINTNPGTGSCANDLIEFQLQPGGFSSYTWSFGDGDTVITVGNDIQHSYTTTGTYTVSCKVKNGCGNTTTLYTTVSVTGNALVNSSLSLTAVQNPACKGDEVFIVPSNGQTTYTYVWNFGDGSAKDTSIGAGVSHTYTANGSYTVSAVVTNGCGSTGTVTVTEVISNSSTPTLKDAQGNRNWGFPGSDHDGGSANAGCAGDAVVFYFMGSADNLWQFGDGDSGVATEHMLVYGGDGSFPVTVIKHSYSANGTYTVRLTLKNGCGNSVTDSMVISIGGNLQVNGDMTTSPPPFSTCAAINFIAFGGTSYKWDFGDGSNSLTTPSPTVSHTYATQGVYVATVLVTNGCGNTATYSRSINVSGAGGPSLNLSKTSPTCVGGGNGSASVTVTNGQPPYIYSWSTGQVTSAISNLTAGIYYATVTDNLGCSSTSAVNVNDPAAIALSGSSTNASCGSSDGTASVTVTSGGTSPYSYLWSNGQTTTTATGFGVGSYAVAVTDKNGCTASKNISVSEANGATLTLGTVTNTSCSGGSDGSVSISVSGGTPPYHYAWSNGATTQNITGLAAGNYSVIVTDNGSCKATLNATVSQPSAILITTSVSQSPTCGNFDGSASATVSGGTAPYTYLWDPGTGSQTTQSATGLPSGSYTVTVLDSKGCSKYGVVSLSNSNSPSLSAVVKDVSCNGGSDGAVDLTVTGGTSPYLYNWSVNFPNNTQDVSNLVPGSYFVSVTDKKGCQAFHIYTISQPAVLTVSVSNTGATCGNIDGTATASPSGGNVPYTYLWSGGGQTAQTAVGLAPGSYSVAVTDSKGCTTTGTTTIGAMTQTVSICMVTVDTTSTKNVIVWTKPSASNIDSFFVYREIASAFTYVGGVPYASLSEFTDTTKGVNPNITSYRYELAVKDICGGVSAKSAPHRTINLSVNPHSPCGYTLFWNDYSGFPVTQYRILRDSAHKGWKAVDSVSFGTTQWIDNTCYPSQDTIEYLVEIDHPTGCVISHKNPVPDASNLNTSKSNIYRTGGGLTSVHSITSELPVNLYPNPSDGFVTLDLGSSLGIVNVKLFSVLGEQLSEFSYAGGSKTILNLSRQAAGVYYLRVTAGNGITTKKIIIE